MVNWLWSLEVWKSAGVWLAAASLWISCAAPTPVLAEPGAAAEGARAVRERSLPGSYPEKPSLPVSWSIPVEPLGFSAPGPLYMGQRNSLVSLDFIDENRLLFTFRVPGLIRRDLKPGESADNDERRIRAVVLTLPEGNVAAEGLWTVHDRSRYLWMLKDGSYLLRDRDSLQQGDAQLNFKPLLQFPGALLGVELDPSQEYLVSNSFEPAEEESKPGVVGSPPTASVTMTQDNPEVQGGSGVAAGDVAENKPPTPSSTVVRILRRETGQVMLVSRVRSVVHLPINSQGYVESLRGRGLEWVINMNYFSGGSRILGSVESTCAPTVDFIGESEILAAGCDGSGGRRLVAMTTEGKTLWIDVSPNTAIWPLLRRSAGGLRILHETLAVTHPISAYAPLSIDDIKGQLVRVFDAATGDIAFESPASPTFDAGGNAAISPSGRRVAVVNAGAIQVFELPPPPALPAAETQSPAQ